MNNDTIYRDFESWIIDDCPINAYGMLHYGNKDDARKVAEVFAFFYQCDFNIAYDVIMKYKQNNKTNKNELKNMNKKNIIKLTESDLKRVISESVKRVLKEGLGKRPYSDITDINVSINSMVDMLEKVSETYSGELDDETRNMIAEIDNHFNEASELVYRLYYKLAFGQEPSYYNGGSEQHDYSGLSGWGV